jgi:hypothetical protein
MNAKCKSLEFGNTFTFGVHHFTFDILFLELPQ